jgi:hypothetical protein
MRRDTSLAQIIRDYGDRWEIEHTEVSTRWVAVRRDGDDLRIIGAHDLGALRFRLAQAECDKSEDDI